MKNNYLITFILVLVSVINFPIRVQAQSDTEFWFVAPQLDDNGNTYMSNFNRPVYFMIVAGDKAAVVTMEMPALPGFANRVLSLAAYQSAQIIFGPNYTTFSDNQMDTIQNNVRTAGIVGVKYNRGIHFSSTAPVSIYYQVDSYNSKDMFVLKGTKALGMEFYTPFQTLFRTNNIYPYAYPQFHIVATENNTTVQITPTANIVGTTAGTTKTVILNQGETFAARADTFMQTTRLAGSHVIANKPIAITVCDDKLWLDVFGDVSGDQIVPINNLGTTYVIIRGYASSHTSYCDKIFILATQNGTTVSIDGVQVATLNIGQQYIHSMPTALTAIIESNHPVYVYQLSGYGATNGTEVGAALLPSMYSINSRHVTFYKSASGYNHNVFVLVRAGNESFFTVNGNASVLTASDFMNVSNISGWKYARKDISSLVPNGTITINNSKGAFSAGYFYTGDIGDGASASYGYLSQFGTFSLPDTIYKCEGESIILDGGYAKSYLWTFPNGSTANTATITTLDTGRYIVTVNQDPFLITDTTIVIDRFSGSYIVSSGNDVGGGNYTYTVNLNGQTSSNIVYTWKIDSVVVATTNVFSITWTDSSEKLITIELTDTVLNCTKILSIKHYKLPDNINDEDCYVEPQGNAWQPILLLKSSPTNYFAYGSPVLAGDLDSDGDVEIVLNDGSPDFGTRLVILDNDLNVKYTLTSSEQFANTTVTFSMANVDGGSNAAIFIATRYRQLKKFTLNTSTRKYEEAWSVSYSTNANYDMGNPLITDFNGDGYPEISVYDKIFDAQTGALLADGNYLGTGTSIANPYKFGMRGGHLINSTNAIHASIMAVGDIDGDGFPELIGGNCAYKVIINSRTNPTLNSFILLCQANTIGHPEVGDGPTSLADMDLDGKLDVIVTRNINTSYHGLYIWNPRTGEVIHSDIINNLYVSNSGNYGPSLAAVGNLDSDPLPEIAFIGFDYMYVYDYYPTTKHLTQKWNRYVNDESAITLFDFNQDNKFELVYRDFTNLMVIEGETQQVLTNISCGSGTANEYPLILDINNDGHAEFVIVAGGNNALNGTVRIYGLNTWAPARKVWNQFAYNSVNINEDLTIPRYQLNPATVFPGKDGILGTADDVRPYNGYLMQQTILNKNGNPLWLAPDATFAGDPVFNYYAAGDSLVISLSVTNLGDASLQPPFYISTYKNIIHGANKLTTDSILNLIYPEDTSAVRIVVHNIISHLPIDSIIISLNDKGQAIIIQQECDTTNNIVVKEFSETLETVNDSICYGETYNRNGLNFIALQDTMIIVKITLGDGRDSLIRLQVHVLDTSLYVFYDTVNLGESSYSKFGFSLPSDSLKQTGTNLYTVKYINRFGCDSIHLLYLTVGQIWLFPDTMFLCQYDSGIWRNKSLPTSMSGSFIVWDSLKTEQGFDSLYRLMLMIQPTYLFDDTLVVCRDEIAEWRNRTLSTSTVGMFTIWDSLKTFSLGCDSLYRLTLTILPTYFFDDTLSVCHKAIISWHGIQLPTAVSGIFIFWDSLKTSHYGCDSIYKLTLLVNTIPDFEIKTEGDICENDSIKLYVDMENVSYYWTTGDTTNYTFVCQNGVYGVSVSIEGCTTLQDIHVECPCDLWLPNIFTPNRDPFNEEFFPVPTSKLSSFSMYIYDRWGSLIYKTDTLTPWNGTYNGREAAAGVYYCVVHYSCTKDPAKKIRTKQGSVTLVR